jgi:hypothetical protein
MASENPKPLVKPVVAPPPRPPRPIRGQVSTQSHCCCRCRLVMLGPVALSEEHLIAWHRHASMSG